MIRFAAFRRPNDYSNAGRIIANEYGKIQAASANNRIDYSGINNASMNIEAEKKINAINNASKIVQSGIQSGAKVKIAQQNIDSEKDALKRNRKAGKLAAIGTLAQSLGSKSKMKRPLAPSNIDYSSLIEEAELRAKELSKELGNSNAKNNNTANSNAGNTAPKGVEGTETDSVSTSELSPFERLTKVISYAEGTVGDKGFTTQFGGGQFTDLSKHPNNPVPTSWGTESEAAGKFQFMYPTWKRAASALGLTDFSPESQLKAGNWLAQQRGVDTTKAAESYDEFVGMIDKLAPEWAGLPYSPKGGSYYGQPSKDIKKLWEIYNQ